MSIDIVIGRISIPFPVFSEALSFLGPEGLRTAEEVCSNWRKCIQSTHQWEKQCQNMLGIATKIDPKRDLPEGSYKENVKMISSSILGESVWRRYIGKVGPVPRIPETISLKKRNEPDPCDPETTIGKEYVWMYCPSHIETHLEGFSLSESDNPTSEAPKLIEKVGSTVQKVPVTLNNIVELFQRLKTGYPSKYSYIWNKTVEQHGNKKVSAGWICMRKEMIGNDLTLTDQQDLVKKTGVILTQLLHRIIFNFLEHARSNVYPDARAPYICAQTSTLTRDSEGTDWVSSCGTYNSSDLVIHHSRLIAYRRLGMSVALPFDSIV